jgi:ubiquinone/menaquinone biosynthesis C-methylase UbiE
MISKLSFKYSEASFICILKRSTDIYQSHHVPLRSYHHRPSIIQAVKMAPSSQTTIIPDFDASAHFERVASSYEDTSAVMKDMASQLLTLSPPLTPHSVILDNAAGPGTVTGEILRLTQFAQQQQGANHPTIHATDSSSAMIRALEARAAREDWPSGVVKSHVMDSMDLGEFPDDTFTHTYMAAAIFIVPDPLKAIAEIKRTLQPGGVALVTSFEKQEFLQIFQDAQRAIRPDEAMWKGPLPDEWLTEGKLRSVMEGGGFEVEKVEIQRFSAWARGEEWAKSASKLLIEGFTRSITGGWSEEEKGRFEEKLNADLQSEGVKGRRYEMKCFVALARK